MITRRRFLTISAAALATPACAKPVYWQGHALGAEAFLNIRGDQAVANQAIRATKAILADVEKTFSLFDPASEISTLNQTGALSSPSPPLCEVLKLAGELHKATNGAFDPTVQPLWRALATGGDTAAAQALIGWDRVAIAPRRITLGPGQALTLNGIAQGYATDRVAAALRDLGLTEVLVNIGEFACIGEWHIGVEDPAHGLITTNRITDAAVATSSPSAMSLGDIGHIIGPAGQKSQWSTVSVQAPDAALADGLSTALCLLSRKEAQHAINAVPQTVRATLVSFDGKTTFLT
ncbi:FAD:protein FMN transferase [Actibacterium lipolyticum]|uniref:FAD:protein FMN transferase n=1 Tax=Actibacterium lipolyticum TaxID=1524263 RepID=A0A238JVA6_9RHOB|nr:FAD:protein FMN transferase [Actibacterium lipolyticum]SMX34581.1 ApbE family protein [Actibacterium lipolyticum]